MTVFTAANYDPVARMNAARDMHRAKGTTGGKGNAVKAHKAEEWQRDPVREIVAAMRFATSDAIEQFRFDVCGDEWVHLCPF